MHLVQEKAIEIAIADCNLLTIRTRHSRNGKSASPKTNKRNSINNRKIFQNMLLTGIARHNFQDASTVHNFLGLCEGRFEPDKINSVHKEKAAFSFVDIKLRNIDCLIVDECSMISKRTFESTLNVCTRMQPPI